MNRIGKKAVLAGATIGAALSATAAPAAAYHDWGWSGNIDTGHGGGARCRNWLTDHHLPNQQGRIECYLYDTWDDGDAIYVAWNFEGYGNRYMFADLNLHSGQSQYRSDAAQADTQIKVQRWQVCKDVVLNDPCAPTVELRR